MNPKITFVVSISDDIIVVNRPLKEGATVLFITSPTGLESSISGKAVGSYFEIQACKGFNPKHWIPVGSMISPAWNIKRSRIATRYLNGYYNEYIREIMRQYKVPYYTLPKPKTD